jgi:hypothetical protein
MTQISYSQALERHTPVSENRYDYKALIGHWVLLQINDSDSILTYTRKKDAPRFGHYIRFNASGDCIIGKSAQCGNDPTIFMNFGKWEISYIRGIIETEHEILGKAKRFKILKLGSDTLCLKYN